MNVSICIPVAASRRILRTALSLLLLLAAENFVRGQEFRATVTGLVTDPQGAALPGVSVTVTNINTNVSVSTLSNESGNYTVPMLQPGEYRVTAEQPGFEKFTRERIVLRTAERATVNIPLALGEISETINVTGEVSGLDTNESTVAQTMENKRVSELPLNGRQAYMLLQLTAGTLFTQTTFGSTGFSGTRAWDTNGNISIHGSRIGNNEFLIDGAPNSATGGWQYAPVVDAIEEFKVQTSSVDASYGRTSGGVVNMTLKSGTNNLHGSAFLFHRGNALDANTTQNKRNGIPRRGHRFDDFGGVIDGPIRRDKTFFMGFYEGFREHIPFPRTSTVSTDLQRLGDFSQTRNSAGQLVTIYDPLTTRPDPNRPGRFIRDPFAGNRIPDERISPVARRLLDFVPRANVFGEPFTQANNLAVSPNLGIYSYNSYLARIDHHFSDRHRIFVSNTANWGVEFRNQNGFPIPSLRGNWPKHRNHYMGTFDDVFTFNPTTVLNVRVAFDRFNDYNPIDYAALRSDLGIQTPFQVVPPQYPYITIDGYQDFFPSTYSQSVNNIYSLQSTLSKTQGRHFLKFGGDFRVYRLNRIGLGDGNGRFDFNRGFTQRDPQQGDATSGNGVASFLLGLPSGGGVDVNATSARQYLYYAAFVQDDWKIARRLALSIGLRWDYQAPVTERFDRQTIGFDSTTPSPFQVPGLQLRGGLLFAGVDSHRRGAYKPNYTNIQPRVGIAYDLGRGLVFRANYGRSYLPLTGSGEEGIQQTGFGRRTGFISSIRTGLPFNTLDRPYPEGILQPFGASLGLATNIGSGFTFINPDFKTPYVDQWMIGFSVELPAHVTVNASYVGNRTTKLAINGRRINEVPRAEREKAIERLGGNPSYLSDQVPNPFAGLVPGTPLNNATVRREQLLRPFPQFETITMDRDNSGSSRYDALEMTATKRLSGGLVAVFNYTLMKMFESTGYLNNGFDTRPWRALASIDRTHRIALTALYDLPFGRSRWIARNVTGVADKLITGWQLNVIGEIQSGTPTLMPNAILRQPSVKIAESERTLDHWFDNSTRNNPRPDGGYAWDVIPPNDFRVVNERMSDVRDPWRPQWAFSLFKNTAINETKTLQFRVEAFNALNTPIFGGPDTGVTSVRFGRITPNQINFPRHIQLGLRFVF